MKTLQHNKIAIALFASALTLGIGGAAFAEEITVVENPVVYHSDNWQSGNAGAECKQIGDYVYSYKWNEEEAGNCPTFTFVKPDGTTECEGAPNGSETANFYDLDGNLVHSNTITISDSNGQIFDWSSSPNGIGAVIVKAGTGANVWFYDPQAMSDTRLYGYGNKDISHVTFCWNPDDAQDDGQWCSPGYWRQEHHYDSWAVTGYAPSDLFSVALGYYPKLSKLGVRDGATANPTLGQVLNAPQYYGGDAFNAVGDLLSGAHPDVNFSGERVEDSCPLD
ncbi:hypothetical protein [Methylotuvimicrobium buryatense]|uniref:Uncharacterized protein n=1 Tax=Methylotuvimicrobium buryatense TaxID=95641 RepID=A0A4P9UVA1_METBY|nr:hypothetical protein [Methylotuvimicrobium buryatense]QCW84361.1 hypothetical protein EQU24_20585 [Methylotuvimicrobium buryatense]